VADGGRERLVTLFLCGDVMTGRGVDQILPHPGDPELHEPYVRDARDYVRLAERVNGPIPKPVEFGWPWGDALDVLDEAAPDLRVVNLETSVTGRGEPDADKRLHYRMRPENLPCLTVARPDVCVLANNHVLDYGPVGLVDTLDALSGARVARVGAGRTEDEAQRPAVVPVTERAAPPTGAPVADPAVALAIEPAEASVIQPADASVIEPAGMPADAPVEAERRVVVVSAGCESSGIPRGWAARANQPGVDLLPDLTEATACAIAARARGVARPGDVVVVSLHWGSNWGYQVPEEHVRFAHALVDGGVDVVHGHSSHHPRPVEVYRDKMVLYGCGDLINDYEGISGYESYRDELRLLYLATVRPATGALVGLRMVPLRSRRLRLRRAGRADAEHLRRVLDRISRPFGTRIGLVSGEMLDITN
jgi:poly-gamma-glutamate capsule biosynthesis protein CapA/YwtB (metallophosphatase superfamily)